MSIRPTLARKEIGSASEASRSQVRNVSKPVSALDFVRADYFTIEQLAQALRVSVRTLQRWNQRRIGPTRIAVGRLRLVSKVSVEAWLRAHEDQAATYKRRS